MNENNQLEPIILSEEEIDKEIDTEPEIPDTDYGCPGDIESDFITCEDCGQQWEPGEEHDCEGGKEPKEKEN